MLLSMRLSAAGALCAATRHRRKAADPKHNMHMRSVGPCAMPWHRGLLLSRRQPEAEPLSHTDT